MPEILFVIFANLEQSEEPKDMSLEDIEFIVTPTKRHFWGTVTRAGNVSVIRICFGLVQVLSVGPVTVIALFGKIGICGWRPAES